MESISYPDNEKVPDDEEDGDEGCGLPRDITTAGVCDRSDVQPLQTHCDASATVLLPFSNKQSPS